jgi:hypothetical protein
VVTDDLGRIGLLVLDIPELAHASDLVGRLEDRWACCEVSEHDVAGVVVFLPIDAPSDLAQLMRRIERWAAERMLGGIRMSLQGAVYV